MISGINRFGYNSNSGRSQKKSRPRKSHGNGGEQKFDLLFTILHDDARWEQFLTDMGVSNEQLDQIGFNVSLPEQAN